MPKTSSLISISLLAISLTACADTSATPTVDARKSDFAPLTHIGSASISLPVEEETFGPDPAGVLLDNKCLACHSPSMILYQSALNRKQWTGIVDKMRNTYKAPIEEHETEALVDALMAKAPSRP